MPNKIIISVILACLALATGCTLPPLPVIRQPAEPVLPGTQAQVATDEAADAEEKETMAEVASASQSAIVGSVTDMKTGQPAAGVEVVVDGFGRMHTDANGGFKFIGLEAAEYTLTMNLEGQGRAAQGPVFVVVDGQKSVSVDLAYYSRTEPPPVVAPPDLPPAGAAPSSAPLVSAALGLALILSGGALRLWNTRRAKLR